VQIPKKRQSKGKKAMAYLTKTYYRDSFKGEPVDDADFPGLLARAAEIIEEMTMYRVTEAGMPDMQPEMQNRIKNAICAQIEYLDANGGSELDTGTDFQSVGLGRFNYSRAAGADGSTKQSVYAPRALRILYPTGLLYRGG